MGEYFECCSYTGTVDQNHPAEVGSLFTSSTSESSGEIIASFPLCVCGTIQPPQVAVLINSVWAGVKPLLGSPPHI